ncbi:MAG TPA: ABC transporter permease [Thermomicrobiales bacterium]|jgi:oligopeptide transport system permease protein|nr:ABC transporter permease [Thermomicrobiales bacterium]
MEPTSPQSLSSAAAMPTALRTETRTRSNFAMASRRFAKHKLAVGGLVLIVAMAIAGFGAPLLAPSGINDASILDSNKQPDREYWFGTDTIGRDYLTRIMYGVRTSFTVAFAAVAVACLIGVPLGLISGLRGGFIDFVIQRMTEIVTAFPGILFAIFLLTIRGSGQENVILVIGLTSWITLCRLTRAQVLTLREQEYVTAARALGATERSIAVKHMLPNALAPLIVAITLAIPTAIFAEAGLSFLGIGINEPTPSLGKMVGDSAQFIQINWHLGLFPSLAIAAAMLGFTFVGDGLRDALDPRSN